MGDWRVPAPNPKIKMTENTTHGATGGNGTLDSMNDAGMTTESIAIPNMGSERAAPKNSLVWNDPKRSWTADNPY